MRPYDAGKSAYARDHRTSSAQHTRHIVANETMEHYEVSTARYAAVGGSNYRMGSSATNTRDRLIDNSFHREVFGTGSGGGYDAAALAGRGVSRQQQLDALGTRFDHAKQMYQAGGGHQFKMMMQDYRDVAGSRLGADLRQFRM